jgi:hypothetical protein
LLLLGYVLTIDSYSTYNIYCTTLYTRSNDLTFISKHSLYHLASLLYYLQQG